MGTLFRPATGDDLTAVTELVNAAYGHYVTRIGGLPGPMTADYRKVVSSGTATLALVQGTVAGLIVTAVTPDGFLVENVAVHPSRQGQGLGRALLERAEIEARRAGFESIYLYTHVAMTENLALYRRLGYVPFTPRSEADASRVFLRKQLSDQPEPGQSR